MPRSAAPTASKPNRELGIRPKVELFGTLAEELLVRGGDGPERATALPH